MNYRYRRRALASILVSASLAGCASESCPLTDNSESDKAYIARPYSMLVVPPSESLKDDTSTVEMPKGIDDKMIYTPKMRLDLYSPNSQPKK